MNPVDIGVMILKALAAIVPEIAKAINGLSDDDLAKLVASARASIPGAIDTSRDAEIRAHLVDPGGAPPSQLKISEPPSDPYGVGTLATRLTRARSITPNSVIKAIADIKKAVDAAHDAVHRSEAEGEEP